MAPTMSRPTWTGSASPPRAGWKPCSASTPDNEPGGRTMRLKIAALLLLGSVLSFPAGAQAPAKIGVVVMHGKGGSPTRFVSELASALQDQGVLVANLDMPWSGSRNYDVDTAAAEKQVQEALDGMRAKGATKLFVAGHSQGGIFALHVGG